MRGLVDFLYQRHAFQFLLSRVQPLIRYCIQVSMYILISGGNNAQRHPAIINSIPAFGHGTAALRHDTGGLWSTDHAWRGYRLWPGSPANLMPARSAGAI